MMTKVLVERLSVEEGTRLRSIRLRALHEAPDAFGNTFQDAEARTAESWSAQLRELPTFVAVESGLDVGMVRIARDSKTTGTGWLISMWVAPDVRRSGVGGNLVDAVIEWARENGVSRLLLDVADNNAAAVAFYDRKGFKPNGETGSLPPPRQHILEHQRELRL